MRQESDLKASLVFLALGVWACVEANRLGFGSIHAPEPGFFPWLGGLALSGLSLVLFAQAWRGRGTASPGKPQRGEWTRPTILTGALLLYVPLLEPVGYPVATTALCVVALWILGARRWSVTLCVSAGLAAGSFLLFRRVLGVELPAGILAFLG
jgi:putative tricarboxylic transport membrane protein